MDIFPLGVVPIYKLPFSAAFLIFIMFSVIGWVSEVIYVGLTSAHKFVNRGFLHGPLCPIYGVGGVVILMLPEQLYNTWIPLFLSSMILCTIVEYITSWLMEKLFHARWWDYSKHKFNIKGRVCLLNSLLFGIMGLGVIRFVYPHIIDLLNLIGPIWLEVDAFIIGIVLIVDVIWTIYDLVDFTSTMEKLKLFGESLRDHYGEEEWFNNGSLTEMMLSVKEHQKAHITKINQSIIQKIEIISALRHKNVKRFITKFPTLDSKHFNAELADLRLRLSQKPSLKGKKDKKAKKDK